MLKLKPRAWATLVIQGNDLNPDELTRSLGIKPDFTLEKSVPNLQEKTSLPQWQLNSTLPPDCPAVDHLYEILKKLAPKRKEIREIATTHQAIFYLSLEFADLNVEGIRLEPRLLLLLGDLGIHLEILPWLEEQ